jgi:hypothetical protein
MTNNKQQTAVDILCGKLAMKLGIPQAITFYIDHQEEIREAKEMEKERMIGLLKWMNKIASENPMRLETDDDDIVQQYYNETYGGGEQ